MSRFQEYQPNLTYLGRARLHLFKSICLPSITSQTTQNFIWVIKTDPGLDESLKIDFVNIVKPFRNIFFVPYLEEISIEHFYERKHLNFSIWSGDLGIWTRDISKARIKMMTRLDICLLYTSPSPRDRQKSRMPSSA